MVKIKKVEEEMDQDKNKNNGVYSLWTKSNCGLSFPQAPKAKRYALEDEEGKKEINGWGRKDKYWVITNAKDGIGEECRRAEKEDIKYNKFPIH